MTFDLAEYASRPRVIDGAWGTQLQQCGLGAGVAPELWNLANPEAVEQVAGGYVQAGADVIITNTFGGNSFVLVKHGAADRTEELVAAGVAISKKAVAGTDTKVFASVGPTGSIVMMGDVEPEKISEAFSQSAAAADSAARGRDGSGRRAICRRDISASPAGTRARTDDAAARRRVGATGRCPRDHGGRAARLGDGNGGHAGKDCRRAYQESGMAQGKSTARSRLPLAAVGVV